MSLIYLSTRPRVSEVTPPIVASFSFSFIEGFSITIPGPVYSFFSSALGFSVILPIESLSEIINLEGADSTTVCDSLSKSSILS